MEGKKGIRSNFQRKLPELSEQSLDFVSDFFLKIFSVSIYLPIYLSIDI
jgi:hypothetical protein